MVQLCGFRNSEAHRKNNTSYQPARPTPIAIGERRKPQPQGQPGYLRIDTLHQGDRDGVKGIYQINAANAQWTFNLSRPTLHRALAN